MAPSSRPPRIFRTGRARMWNEEPWSTPARAKWGPSQFHWWGTDSLRRLLKWPVYTLISLLTFLGKSGSLWLWGTTAQQWLGTWWLRSSPSTSARAWSMRGASSDTRRWAPARQTLPTAPCPSSASSRLEPKPDNLWTEHRNTMVDANGFDTVSIFLRVFYFEYFCFPFVRSQGKHEQSIVCK